MKRPVARKRQLDFLKRNRKEKIYKEIYHMEEENMPPKGKFTKGKIHCSCPMCAKKTNSNNKNIETGWKHSDLQKLQKVSDKILEEYKYAYKELSKE